MIRSVTNNTLLSGVNFSSRKSSKVPDYLILNYAGFQFHDLGADHPPCGAHHILEQLKALAPLTKDSRVVFFIQGYEKSNSGKWQVARYTICDGFVNDETSNIRGTKLIYDDTPSYEERKVLGKEPATGKEVSLFDPVTFDNFVKDGVNAFPRAKYAIYVSNTHGRGTEGIAGEAIIKGNLDTQTKELLPYGDFQATLRTGATQLNKPFDLVVFDSCIMGQFEVIDGLRQTARHVLASPEVECQPEPTRYPSPQALMPSYKKLLENPTISPLDFARIIFKNTVEQSKYKDCGGNQLDAVPTLALYDTSKTGLLHKLLGELGDSLYKALEQPDLKKAIIEAVQTSFQYPHIVSDFFGVNPIEEVELKDLRSFLGLLRSSGVSEHFEDVAIIDKVDRAMDQSCEEMFKGKLVHTDYSEIGPFSVFMPDVPKNLVINVRVPDDINGLFDDILHALNKDRVSMDFHNLVSYVKTAYPSMLEKLPDDRVKNALAENAPQIKELAEIEEAITDYNLTEDQKSGLKQQKTERMKELVAELKDKFKDVDFKGFVKRYHEGEVKNIGEKFLADYTKHFNQLFEKYSALDSVPGGWKRFIQNLHTVLTAEVLPGILRKL